MGFDGRTGGIRPGGRRPVLVVQADSFNRSRIGTVVIAAITSNTALAKAPGNFLLSCRASGLPKESVVNVSQLIAVDREILTERVKKLSDDAMRKMDEGLRLVLAL